MDLRVEVRIVANKGDDTSQVPSRQMNDRLGNVDRNAKSMRSAGNTVYFMNGRPATTICENYLINIDKQKIAQVVRNLLSNALKFTPKGGLITVTATVILAAVNREVDSVSGTARGPDPPCSLTPPYFRFEVTDTGPGISKVSSFL